MLFLFLAIPATWVALAAFDKVGQFAGLRGWLADLRDGPALLVKSFFLSTALALWLLTLIALFGAQRDLQDLALVVFCIWVGIPFVISRVLPLLDRDEHGSARLMTNKEVAAWADKSEQPGLLLGRSLAREPKDLKYTGDAHLISIAPSRSGKGVSAIIPNLLTYPGSVLVVDPKGENARVTARRRAEIGKTYILDPFATTGLSTASYNPLSRITANNPDANDDAAALADALVVRSGDGDNHWDDEAAALLEGMILFVALYEAPERRHLGTVRELITEGPAQFEKVLEVMQDCGGLVERTANRFISKSDREASSVQVLTRFPSTPLPYSIQT